MGHGRVALYNTSFAAEYPRTDDDKRAIQAVRDALNGLHCSVKARLRLTPRALAQLDLGYVKELGD